jgi:BlaI family transcriptional regulator, penicillinase repressor
MAQTKPTDGELSVLQILWERGPSTVKDIHRALAGDRDLPYTTVLSALQAMHEKGLVSRDASSRQHVYTPSLDELDARSSLVDDLVAKAFRGSAMELVVHALDSDHTTPEDLERLRQLISAKRRALR